MKRFWFAFLIAFMFSGGVVLAQNFISADNSGFEYHGRFDLTNKNEVSFDWSGVYITCAFSGTSCKAVLKGKNIFDINIDGKKIKTIEVNAEKDTFLLADKLSNSHHELRIVKRTESADRISAFYGIVVDDKAKVYKSSAKYFHKIEFIGDSYTAGFGNEYPLRECPPDKCDSLAYSATNTAKSFGALVAAHFRADYQINAISGKGLIRNYNGIDKGKEFSACYERTLQSSINNPQISTASYDLTLWHPEVIVIGIGINDFQADPPYSDTVKYDSAYTQFIKMLGNKHHGVKIICCATQVWPTNALISCVKSIVEKINAGGDKSVYYFEFETENTALYGHPSIKDHEKIAKELGAFIGSIIGWK
jgi:hypothetical protein